MSDLEDSPFMKQSLAAAKLMKEAEDKFIDEVLATSGRTRDDLLSIERVHDEITITFKESRILALAEKGRNAVGVAQYIERYHHFKATNPYCPRCGGKLDLEGLKALEHLVVRWPGVGRMHKNCLEEADLLEINNTLKEKDDGNF